MIAISVQMSAAFAGVNTVQLKRPANTYFSLVPTASMANDSNNYTVCVCAAHPPDESSEAVVVWQCCHRNESVNRAQSSGALD